MFDTYYTPEELERKRRRDAILKKDMADMTDADWDEFVRMVKADEDDKRLKKRVLLGFIIAIGLAAAYPLQALIVFPVFLAIFFVVFILVFFSIF
ncbi:hypothetical protein [Pelistega europaea]|uniref:Uncharacterized protein n=1 Tax=Pelistega europaea TaxID=106147 RepID=A0A7Y4LDP1_9BURK|nr:hypothetical protein [Pelistega europaea]NOL50527.1 hypothetical protein [Pelistega europaea]